MQQKLKFVLGSLAGALAIQFAMTACVSSTGATGAADADAGPLAALDAMVDAIVTVFDSSTRDARAESDGGATTIDGSVATCTCPGGAASGSRLKGEFFTGSDGSKNYKPFAMWDSQDGVEVNGGLMLADGNYYWATNNGSVLLYLDSACTQAIALTSQESALEGPSFNQVPPYVLSNSPPYTVYSLGAAASPPAPTAMLYQPTSMGPDGGSACIQRGTGQSLGGGDPAFTTGWFSVGPERAPSTFVAYQQGHD